jgi:hypothetical protein
MCNSLIAYALPAGDSTQVVENAFTVFPHTEETEAKGHAEDIWSKTEADSSLAIIQSQRYQSRESYISDKEDSEHETNFSTIVSSQKSQQNQVCILDKGKTTNELDFPAAISFQNHQSKGALALNKRSNANETGISGIIPSHSIGSWEESAFSVDAVFPFNKTKATNWDNILPYPSLLFTVSIEGLDIPVLVQQEIMILGANEENLLWHIIQSHLNDFVSVFEEIVLLNITKDPKYDLTGLANSAEEYLRRVLVQERGFFIGQVDYFPLVGFSEWNYARKTTPEDSNRKLSGELVNLNYGYEARDVCDQ